MGEGCLFVFHKEFTIHVRFASGDPRVRDNTVQMTTSSIELQ